MKRQSLCDKMEMKKVRESERGAREREREVFVERLTTPHDLIVLLKTAGVDEREGVRRDAKPHTHCCSVGDKEGQHPRLGPLELTTKHATNSPSVKRKNGQTMSMHITSSERRNCSFKFCLDK